MRKLRLAQHIHYCAIGDERIFLDLAADRYFSLPAEAGAAFRALEKGVAASPDNAGIGFLLRAGILVDAVQGKPIAATRSQRPADSLVETRSSSAAISARALLEVPFLVASARRAIRAKKLPGLLARLRAHVPQSNPCLPKRDRAVAQFSRIRPLVPIAPNCLYDSIALTRFLRRRGIAAALVIGTKLHPFAAHAWVQDGATALNDSVGHARDFQPVLVT